MQKFLLNLACSSEFADWLTQQHLSLAFTTYQTNRLLFLGSSLEGRLKVHERLLDKPMGLFGNTERLYLSTRYQIWEFQNILSEEETYNEADCLFVPRSAYFTGDLNVHDLVINDTQELKFVNTDFSCISRVSQDYSFVPCWKPPFISKLVAEDRCHLNGLAMVQGQPAYVTACSATDTAAGWRNCRHDGGIVIDVAQNEIIARGLSMPHSPRYYQGKLWLLNSGTGEFGYIEGEQFVPFTFCPGFVRGLAFWGNFAFVGLSKLRSQNFTGLTLEERLREQGEAPRCGLMVIDLATGKPLHWLYFETVIEELFDVVVLPGVRQPKALGLQGDEIQRLVTFPNSGGIIITKPTAQRPSLGATPPIAGLPSESIEVKETRAKSNISNNEVKYQRVYHLNSTNILDYDELTFPRLQKRFKKQPPQGEVTGLSASVAGAMVGFAIAERLNLQQGEIISLFVLPEYRNQGIGTRLVAYLEKELAQQGCTELIISYHTSLLTKAALEPLLQKLNWSTPTITLVLGKTSTEKIALAPWLQKYPLPPTFEVFPWLEESSTSNGDHPLEPLNSLGLRYGGEVIGRVLTHRVASDTIRYTTLEMAEPFQRKGRGVSLLAEAISRQVNSDVPYLTGAVSPGYPGLWQFVGRHLTPYLIGLGEVRQTNKLLAQISQK
ncbi:TIGR03032 family protein [Gloeothece verrucosa]|uniref:GCN5-related N-acetyltransferase n=1 Tax=Gloeothece verrucosa (strain PCC 7822) TaxID=497965 RepID=E0UNA3_GLOV7|nr:TIGR03032 family protein [Gloeothece verrucosa]ADN18433.1 GCN5-related N-acetyltransferase [Gloeothece verrucosa PCC 7822]